MFGRDCGPLVFLARRDPTARLRQLRRTLATNCRKETSYSNRGGYEKAASQQFAPHLALIGTVKNAPCYEVKEADQQEPEKPSPKISDFDRCSREGGHPLAYPKLEWVVIKLISR